MIVTAFGIAYYSVCKDGEYDKVIEDGDIVITIMLYSMMLIFWPIVCSYKCFELLIELFKLIIKQFVKETEV